MKFRPSMFPLVLALAASAAVPTYADETGAPPAAAGEKHAEAEWLADFDKAVEAAKAAKKDLLVDFTGSDWCGWCKKLHAEVFAQPEFIAEAPKSFVLVALDFPRAPEIKAKVPNPVRNAELQKKYGVRGFPTILVLNPEGQVIVQTGYRPDGAKPYLEFLATAYASGKETLQKIQGIEKAFADATGDAKFAAAGQALDLFEKLEGEGPATALIPLMGKFPALDADNARGVKLRAMKALMGAGRADDALLADARAFDPKNENGLLELVVLSGLQKLRNDSPEEALEAFVADARALAATGNLKNLQACTQILVPAIRVAKDKLEDVETARSLAKVLKEKGPQDNAGLTKFLDSVLAEESPAPAK